MRFLAAADRYVAQRGSLRTVRKDYVGEEGYPLGRNVMYYRNLKNGTKTKQTKNRALSAARAPVERGMARLKSWQIFRRSRISPNRMSVISRAVLTLERQC
ncbi:transposase family protein (plasmid) [Streptomyces anulatus]